MLSCYLRTTQEYPRRMVMDLFGLWRQRELLVDQKYAGRILQRYIYMFSNKCSVMLMYGLKSCFSPGQRRSMWHKNMGYNLCWWVSYTAFMPLGCEGRKKVEKIKRPEKVWYILNSVVSNIRARPCYLCTCFSHFLFILSHLYTICLILSFLLCLLPYHKHTWYLFAMQEEYWLWSGTGFGGYPKEKGMDLGTSDNSKGEGGETTACLKKNIPLCSKRKYLNA